jgi:hypothetical protein
MNKEVSDMTTRMAYIEKTWGECRRPGRGKVEDYSWEVSFCEGFPLVVLDRHCYNNEELALTRSRLFELGKYTLGEHKEIKFEDEEECIE